MFTPKKLTISQTTESTSAACFLDLPFAKDENNNITMWQAWSVWFHSVNFLFMLSNIPSAPAYGVYVPAQLDSLARFDPPQTGPGLIWRGSKRAKESQYGLDHKTIEQNEFQYDSMSLSYILLCNSLALSGIQSIFGMDATWHKRHQPIALLLW